MNKYKGVLDCQSSFSSQPESFGIKIYFGDDDEKSNKKGVLDSESSCSRESFGIKIDFGDICFGQSKAMTV